MKYPKNKSQTLRNTRPSSNGFSARKDPNDSSSTSPPFPYCEDAEAEERFRKFLEIMGEIDLQRLSDLMRRRLGNKFSQPDAVPAYNRNSVSKR